MIDPNLFKLGKNIRDAREKMGLSQEDFARSADIARSYFGRVERGEQNVSVKTLIKIAKTLKIEMGNLFPALKNIV